MSKFHLLELKLLFSFALFKKTFFVGKFVVERCWEESSNGYMAIVKEVKVIP